MEFPLLSLQSHICTVTGEANAKTIRYLRMLRNPNAADILVDRHRATKNRHGMPRRMARKQGG
jgi:hypothetical protein